jgi:hypothetical protein
VLEGFLGGYLMWHAAMGNLTDALSGLHRDLHPLDGVDAPCSMAPQCHSVAGSEPAPRERKHRR